MNILILAATAFELNSIREKIKEIKSEKNIDKLEEFNNLNFSFFCTGIGNFEVILNLTKYLENNQEPDFIINLGICGYLNEYKTNISINTGKNNSCIQIGRIFGAAKEKEFLIPQFINFLEISSIYSSEKIIYNKENISQKNINFVEMESFGIEYILEKKGTPRLYLKFPFDKIGGENNGENKTINFKEKLPEIKNLIQNNIDYKKLFQKIEIFLKKNQKISKNNFNIKFKKELEFLENKSNLIGNLTFQDKNNFEKLFYKYESLSEGKKIFEVLKKILLEEEKFFNDEKKIFKIKKNFLIEKININIEEYLV